MYRAADAGATRTIPTVGDPEHVSTTRLVYDASAEFYAERIGTTICPATEGPIDRAALEAFVELVGTGTGRVADVGCGPGRVASLLADRGMDVVGVDVSRQMVAIARQAHPGITFREGRLTELPFDDRSLAGIVCWYSVIHTPPENLSEVAAELARVLAPGAQLLVAFQAGAGESIHRADAYGTTVRLTSYRHDPDDVARHLITTGLTVHTRISRDAMFEHESTPQAFLFAHRASSTPST